MDMRRRTARWPFVASALVHLAALAVVAGLTRMSGTIAVPPEIVGAVHHAADEEWVTHLVFVPSSGAPGGGGGGGNRQKGPMRRAEGRGTDALTLRVARPRSIVASPVDSGPSPPAVLLDARSLASGEVDQIGLPEGGVPDGTSTGPGSGGGVGSGVGTGIGSGTGPGVGPGTGGGFGGNVYRVGGGVSAPTVLREVKPTYPPDALHARIQGAVVLALIVTSDGIPADIRVIQSLAPDLDEAAVRAVREWRFNPGRRGSTPVNVAVTIVLDFSIR
jgi:periplasmic protein TonB